MLSFASISLFLLLSGIAVVMLIIKSISISFCFYYSKLYTESQELVNIQDVLFEIIGILYEISL